MRLIIAGFSFILNSVTDTRYIPSKQRTIEHLNPTTNNSTVNFSRIAMESLKYIQQFIKIIKCEKPKSYIGDEDEDVKVSQNSKICPEKYASILSKILFTWVWPYVSVFVKCIDIIANLRTNFAIYNLLINKYF
jgi:hypothetical protein